MLLWIPLLPFAGFLVNNFGGRRLSKNAVGAVASGAMFVAFLASVMAVRALVSLPAEEREITQTIFTWIGSGDFQVPRSAVQAVHSKKVIFECRKLDASLRRAIGHAHDAEVPGL